jgi:hypothetical protein
MKPMPAKPTSDPVSFQRTTHLDEILREAGYDAASIQNLRGLPGWWGEVRLSIFIYETDALSRSRFDL